MQPIEHTTDSSVRLRHNIEWATKCLIKCSLWGLIPKVEGDFAGLLIAGPWIYLPAAEATNVQLGIFDSSLAALRGMLGTTAVGFVSGKTTKPSSWGVLCCRAVEGIHTDNKIT